MPPPLKRWRMLSTSVEDLLALLPTGAAAHVARGLPDDASIVFVGHAPGDRLGVVLESKTFDLADSSDLNALPRVVLELQPLIKGPTFKAVNQKTSEAREVQAWVPQDPGAKPERKSAPRVQLAAPSELGAVVKARAGSVCAACGGTGRGN